MLKPYRKITKKELKEDKFVTYTIQAKEFVENNTRLLMWGGVIVVALVLAVIFISKSKRQANVSANELLGKVQFAFAQGKEAEAESQLKSLVEDYEGVTAAGQGCFLLAKYYWQKDDFANAKIYFKKYIDDYGDDDLLKSASLAGYGDCLLEDSIPTEAALYYERAGRVDKNLPQTPSYLFSAAQAYKDAGNLDKAEKIANEIIEKYDKSNYKQKAEILINMIKLKV